MWQHLADFIKNIFLLTERLEQQRKETVHLREGLERLSIQVAELAAEVRQQQKIQDLKIQNLILQIEVHSLRDRIGGTDEP